MPIESRWLSLEAQRRQLSGELIEQSFLGRSGQVDRARGETAGMGLEDRRRCDRVVSCAEVIIATLGTIYSLGGDVDAEDEGLQAAIARSRWPDGRPVYTLPVALSIMVFFALVRPVRRHVDGHQTRDQFLALASIHLCVHDLAGLYRCAADLSSGYTSIRRLSQIVGNPTRKRGRLTVQGAIA